ncbi:MAG: hypothetical protein V1684_00780 [bacterium]
MYNKNKKHPPPPVGGWRTRKQMTEDKNQNDILSTEELGDIKNLLEDIQSKVNRVYGLLESRGLMDQGGYVLADRLGRVSNRENEEEDPPAGGGEERIIEGVFDGQNMVGPDGKQYSVPANYASKSKLVEGDILKLTITPRGSFIYKQIEPIERKRLMGTLNENEATGEFSVITEEGKWKVLTASVTYFKGGAGDEVVILIPQKGQSKWAAVENIIKTA